MRSLSTSILSTRRTALIGTGEQACAYSAWSEIIKFGPNKRPDHFAQGATRD